MVKINASWIFLDFYDLKHYIHISLKLDSNISSIYKIDLYVND